jgi:hypothetical protein
MPSDTSNHLFIGGKELGALICDIFNQFVNCLIVLKEVVKDKDEVRYLNSHLKVLK